MSKALDIADGIAARLSALDALDGVAVVVDRQKDIAAEVAKAVAKVSECCVVILYTGFDNPDANASGNPKVTRRYSVSVFGRPVLRDSEATPADDIMETVARSLHNWEPEVGTDGFHEIHVTGGDLRPDPKFLAYIIDLKITSIL